MDPDRKPLVLLVDDEPELLDSFRFGLPDEFELVTVTTREEAENQLLKENLSFDAAIVDMQLGADSKGGRDLIKWLKKYDPLLQCIVLTGYPDQDNVRDSFMAEAFDFVVKGATDVDIRLTKLLRSARVASITPKVETVLTLVKAQKMFFEKMVHRDPFYFGHGNRVSKWSLRVGERLGLSQKEKSYLDCAALFHDIGKEKLWASFKPGKLTKEEEKRSRKYPNYSHDMLKEIFAQIDMQPKAILDAILYHRENWDGTGFPDGRQKEQIPNLARIIAVACEFDHALTQLDQRFVRDPESARKRLEQAKGSRLDPEMVEAFLEAFEDGHISRDHSMGWREEEFDNVRLLMESGRIDDARSVGDRWIREINEAPEYDCIRAAAYLGLGDLFASKPNHRERALGYYTDATQLHPAYAEAYYKRGCCYLKQNCWKEAERDFDVATAIVPTYLEAHLERAAIFLRTLQYREANRLYDRVLALDPGNAVALIGKAKIFLAKQESSDALGCLTEAAGTIAESLRRDDLNAEERIVYEELHREQLRLLEEVRSRQTVAEPKTPKKSRRQIKV